MNHIADLEYDLMSYCLRLKGKWWANHFFRNEAVSKLYAILRVQDVGTVIAILGSKSNNWQRHVVLGKQVMDLLTK